MARTQSIETVQVTDMSRDSGDTRGTEHVISSADRTSIATAVYDSIYDTVSIMSGNMQLVLLLSLACSYLDCLPKVTSF